MSARRVLRVGCAACCLVLACRASSPREAARARIDKAGLPFTAEGFYRGFANPELRSAFLQAGMSPNATDPQGVPILFRLGADPQAVKSFVDAGASIDVRDREGNTLLIEVVRTGVGVGPWIARYVEMGADVNAQNKRGEAALHLAAGTGKLEEIKALLQAGADVNLRDAEGATPLIRATQHLAWVADFVKAGADVNAMDGHRYTALMYAVKLDNYQTVKLLLDAGAATNATGENGETALSLAAPGSWSRAALEQAGAR